ncbi:putative pre-mRNA splicing factor [Linnemannia elongata]|nr:serine arginine-rich splicing factor [Linnemannia elongata]KAH7038765.1 putative pre-mRNA splicing factor [Linnemannia elongata]KAK5821548.1 putative pre-mRNA splicing factor [Linnemannia elongata]
MSTRVYLGRLARDASDRDVESLFKSYGRLREVTLKNGFGFVEFSDPRDAKDAVYDFHGKEFMGERLVVELARGDRRDRREDRDDRRFRPPERTEHRLIVENLAHGVSWQDIKDFMRKAGEVTFADISKDNDSQGVVEFSSADDVQNALKSLDGEELRGNVVTLREFDPARDTAPRDMGRGGGRDRDRGRDFGRDRRRSRSRSRDRGDRYRRGRSRTPSRDRRDRYRRRSRSRSAGRRDDSRERRGGGGRRRSSRSPAPRSPVRGDRSSPAPAGGAREHSPRGDDAGAGRDRSPSRERSRSPEQRERSRSASRD